MMGFLSRKRDREQNRYYLLPGMGRSNRLHRALVYKWAVFAGFILALLFSGLLYYINR